MVQRSHKLWKDLVLFISVIKSECVFVKKHSRHLGGRIWSCRGRSTNYIYSGSRVVFCFILGITSYMRNVDEHGQKSN